MKTPTTSSNIDSVAQVCVDQCKTKDIEDPVEILRCAQSLIVTGRQLEIQDVSVNVAGATHFI